MPSPSRIRVDLESLSRFRKPGIRPLRYLIAVVGVLALLSLLFTPTAREYVPYDRFKFGGGYGGYSYPGVVRPNTPVNVTITPALDPLTNRANASILMLARNSDLPGVEHSMRRLEQSFNQHHNYPWTFINEVPFSLDFKRKVREIASGDVHFGLIKSEDWYPPAWIDDEKYEKDRMALEALRKVPYAGSMTYRNMCRFNSGFFYRQEILKQFKWYWRVEPNVDFPCEIPYDPFEYMITHNKRYSFTITIPEYGESIPTLWDSVKDFIRDNQELLPDSNALAYLSDDNGDTYNRCHFWSNFEIGDMDFFRSEAYGKFFETLDRTGKFFYERWGDAPVHSIGVALLLPREQIHYFDDIGYFHGPFYNCPRGELHEKLKCTCVESSGFDAHGAHCLNKFDGLFPDGERG